MDRTKIHSTTEFINLDGNVTPGPDLPLPLYDHCMVTLPSGKIMIIGDHSKEKIVLVFDPRENKFEKSAFSYHGKVGGKNEEFRYRYKLDCAVFNSPLHNFRPVVLATGKWPGGAYTEILDFTQPNSTWTKGKINLLSIYFEDWKCPISNGLVLSLFNRYNSSSAPH